MPTSPSSDSWKSLLTSVGISSHFKFDKKDFPKIINQLSKANDRFHFLEKLPSDEELRVLLEKHTKQETNKDVASEKNIAKANNFITSKKENAEEALPAIWIGIPLETIDLENIPYVETGSVSTPMYSAIEKNKKETLQATLPILSNISSTTNTIDKIKPNFINDTIKTITPKKENVATLTAHYTKKTQDTKKQEQNTLFSRHFIQKGIIHRTPGRLYFAALSTVLAWIICVMSLLSLLLYAFDFNKYLLPIGIIGFFFFVLMMLFFARLGRCTVCGITTFVPAPSRSKNKLAHHILFLGTSFASALHVVLFRWFRCPVCGSTQRVASKKNL